jgi:uncharacterized membrane protein
MSVGRFIGVALLVAIVTHLTVIFLAPDFIMRTAMQRMGAANAWVHPPRVSEDSRAIVRPSPDLAYSVCVFDLANGPLRIAAEGWDDYVSLSLYAANGDNFFTLSDREAPDGIDIVLTRAGAELDPNIRRAAPRIVESPGGKGIALIRRLAPTAERFEAAQQVQRGDVCGPAPIPRTGAT